MNEDILEYKGTYYTLSETRMPFRADKTVDEDYFILTLLALALEAKSRGIMNVVREYERNRVMDWIWMKVCC